MVSLLLDRYTAVIGDASPRDGERRNVTIDAFGLNESDFDLILSSIKISPRSGEEYAVRSSQNCAN